MEEAARGSTTVFFRNQTENAAAFLLDRYIAYVSPSPSSQPWTEKERRPKDLSVPFMPVQFQLLDSSLSC